MVTPEGKRGVLGAGMRVDKRPGPDEGACQASIICVHK